MTKKETKARQEPSPEIVRKEASPPSAKRFLFLLLLTLILSATMFLFTSKVYDTLSPLALRWVAIARWALVAGTGVLAALSFMESRKPGSHRTVQLLALANIICIIVVSFVLEPPPKLSKYDVEQLKTFNATFDGVRVSPDMEAIAKATELSGVTDPLHLAQSSLVRNKLEESLRLFNKGLVEMEPMERVIAETHFYKGLTLSRLNRHKEALHESELALAISPRFAPGFYLKCKTLRKLERFDEALATCKQAVQDDPTNAPAWSEQRAVFVSMGLREHERVPALYEEALAALAICLKALPDNPAPWNNKAVALRRLKRPKEALEAVDRALTLRHDYVDALLNKATILKDIGRLNEAIETYRKLTRINPHDPEAWSNLGDGLEHQGLLAEALEAYDAAIQSKPNFGDAWYNKGHVLNKLQRYDEARAALEQAIELNDKDYEALFECSASLVHLNRRQEALKLLARALALKPGYRDALELRMHLMKHRQ